jgi:hypothetical protein
MDVVLFSSATEAFEDTDRAQHLAKFSFFCSEMELRKVLALSV